MLHRHLGIPKHPLEQRVGFLRAGGADRVAAGDRLRSASEGSGCATAANARNSAAFMTRDWSTLSAPRFQLLLAQQFNVLLRCRSEGQQPAWGGPDDAGGEDEAAVRERFLDNFERSQLRQEVQAVKPRKRLQGLRRKTATWALGASLALGGIGAPLKMVQQNARGAAGSGAKQTTSAMSNQAGSALESSIASDIRAARSIADEVAGGVEAAVEGVEAAAKSPLAAVAEAPKQARAGDGESAEDFFKKEIPFGSIIYKEAKKNNVRPELVAAVVQAESKFKPTARSGAGAVGLMQLVPRTGRWMGARDLMNPQQNVAAGAKYLKYLHDRFDGNETNVIAAYNAGEGNVKRFGGVQPFRETRNYLTRVRNFDADYRNRVENRASRTCRKTSRLPRHVKIAARERFTTADRGHRDGHRHPDHPSSSSACNRGAAPHHRGRDLSRGAWPISSPRSSRDRACKGKSPARRSARTWSGGRRSNRGFGTSSRPGLRPVSLCSTTRRLDDSETTSARAVIRGRSLFHTLPQHLQLARADGRADRHRFTELSRAELHDGARLIETIAELEEARGSDDSGRCFITDHAVVRPAAVRTASTARRSSPM
jgi:soluble lytic murein transglycosylase-like protein